MILSTTLHVLGATLSMSHDPNSTDVTQFDQGTLLLNRNPMSAKATTSEDPNSYLIQNYLLNPDDLLLYIFTVYVTLALLGNALLAAYHTGITSFDLTTNEHVKNIDRVNPFDKGCKRNWYSVWCEPEKILDLNDKLDIRTTVAGAGGRDREDDCVSLD